MPAQAIRDCWCLRCFWQLQEPSACLLHYVPAVPRSWAGKPGPLLCCSKGSLTLLQHHVQELQACAWLRAEGITSHPFGDVCLVSSVPHKHGLSSLRIHSCLCINLGLCKLAQQVKIVALQHHVASEPDRGQPSGRFHHWLHDPLPGVGQAVAGADPAISIISLAESRVCCLLKGEAATAAQAALPSGHTMHCHVPSQGRSSIAQSYGS